MTLLCSCNHSERGQCPLLIHQRKIKMLKLLVSTMRTFDLPPVICVAERLGAASRMMYLRCFLSVSEQTGRKAAEEGQEQPPPFSCRLTVPVCVSPREQSERKGVCKPPYHLSFYSLSLTNHLFINHLSLPVSCSLFSPIPVLSLFLLFPSYLFCMTSLLREQTLTRWPRIE